MATPSLVPDTVVPGTVDSSRWLRHFIGLLILATLVLIFLGGQVKSHDAGLSVPDWPTTYGQNMFLFPFSDWVGGIFHEHLHRLVASGVGLLTIVLALWLALRERRVWIKVLGFSALGAVILQGVLGGMTVWYLLPTWLSVSHALLAQTFLVLLVIIAYGQSRQRALREEDSRAMAWSKPAKSALALVAVVYLQLLLGALMRHMEAGLAIPDFPATGGRFFPWLNADTLRWINNWRFDYTMESGYALDPVTMGQVLIHFAHRVGAIAVTVSALITTLIVFRRREATSDLRATVCLVDLLLLGQVVLGAFTVWTHRMPLVTSVHVAAGAVLLALATWLALKACPLRLHEAGEQQTRGELNPHRDARSRPGRQTTDP